MAEIEQAKPLAPAESFHNLSDKDESIPFQSNRRHRNCIKCCGCVTALLLIIVVVILILTFTVFQIHNPKITMNSVTISQLDLTNETLNSGENITVTADVSVKNPNVAAFRYSNTTTTLYYAGTVVGAGSSPPGVARAKRTVRMNLTLDISPEKISAVPGFVSDVSTGALRVSTYTRIGGKVKILNIIRRNVVVRMNCTMTYNFTSKGIQDEDCKRHVAI